MRSSDHKGLQKVWVLAISSTLRMRTNDVWWCLKQLLKVFTRKYISKFIFCRGCCCFCVLSWKQWSLCPDLTPFSFLQWPFSFCVPLLYCTAATWWSWGVVMPHFNLISHQEDTIKVKEDMLMYFKIWNIVKYKKIVCGLGLESHCLGL